MKRGIARGLDLGAKTRILENGVYKGELVLVMVAAGTHPKYLQIQIGHSSIRATLDLYGHRFPDANRGALDALCALTAPSTPHLANRPKIASKRKSPRKRGLSGRERRDSNPRPPA